MFRTVLAPMTLPMTLVVIASALALTGCSKCSEQPAVETPAATAAVPGEAAPPAAPAEAAPAAPAEAAPAAEATPAAH